MVTSTLSARLLIVDDHTIFRFGFKTFLEDIGGLAVVGDANSGEEALELLDKTQPDLAIIDVRLKDMSGIELTQKVKQDNPGIRVLVTSAYEERAHVEDALTAGADGFVFKHLLDGDLVEATETLLNGEDYLCDRSKALLEAEDEEREQRRELL